MKNYLKIIFSSLLILLCSGLYAQFGQVPNTLNLKLNTVYHGSNATNNISQGAMIGFFNGATPSYDHTYDAPNKVAADVTSTFYVASQKAAPNLTTFAGSSLTINAIAANTNNQIYVGGYFSSFNGTSANSIIRLTLTNGIAYADQTFNIGSGFNNPVNSIVIDSNGKILVGGEFTSYNGTTANSIIRLNTDGSIDTGFNNGGSGFNQQVKQITIDPSTNKIYCSGTFTSYNGTTANYIIRLNTDGSIDTGFNSGTGFNNWTLALAVDSNGKLLVGGGNATSYNGTTTNGLTYINSDGSINTSFKCTGIGANANNDFIRSILIDSNNKIYLVGGMDIYYTGFPPNQVSNPAHSIIRLNSDGSVDSGFSMGSGFQLSGTDASARSIAIDKTTGKLYVAGNGTSYNGTSVNQVVRLNTNGTLDTSFAGQSFGSGKFVYALCQVGNSVYCGGDFTTYNSLTDKGIAPLSTTDASNTWSDMLYNPQWYRFSQNMTTPDSLYNSTTRVLTMGVQDSTYTLTWDVSQFGNDVGLKLIDTQLGTTTHMKDVSTYTFTASANSLTPRFRILTYSTPTYPSVLGSSKGSVNTASTTFTVTYPSGIQAGELLVLTFAVNGSASITPANGFTSYTTDAQSTNVNFWNFYKIASGTESGNISFTASASTKSAWIFMRFTAGSMLNNGFNYNQQSAAGTTANSTFNTIYFGNAGSEYTTLVSFRAGKGNSGTQPTAGSSGWTFFDSQASSGGSSSTNAALYVQTLQQQTTANSTYSTGALTVAANSWVDGIYGVIFPRYDSDGSVGKYVENRDPAHSGYIDTGNSSSRVAIHFVGDGNKIKRIRVPLTSGLSPTGSVTANIYSNASSKPSTLLATSSSVNATSIPVNNPSNALFTWATEFVFSTSFQTTNGTDYWIVYDNGGSGVRYISTAGNNAPSYTGYQYISSNWSAFSTPIQYVLIYDGD